MKKNITRLTESDLIKLVRRIIKENNSNTSATEGLIYKIDWLNHVYQTYIYLKVTKINHNNTYECIVEELEGPFINVKVGDKCTLTINRDKYTTNMSENNQKIEGPIRNIIKYNKYN